MSEWKAKRFWQAANVAEVGGGFGVALDGRPVKTPAKAGLVVPSRALAQGIAAEWDAQEKEIKPETMPLTRAANAAIDKVAVQFTEVADMLAAYGDSDLTCYRATEPAGLIERQAEAWDPLLDWAGQRFGARLKPTQGVMHVAQAPGSLKLVSAPLYEMTEFELTAMHDLVSLSGSLVIGLAAFEDAFSLADLWTWSRIDERWQEELWGEDDEATALAGVKRASFFAAHHFLELVRQP